MMTNSVPVPDTAIRGGLCLLPGQGLVAADLHLSAGKIARVATPAPLQAFDLDARHCIVLPGIIDIHGDAFERQIMPRPSTMFPLDMAMLETDRQLAANGITTAYHGITISWEPGLRGAAGAQRIIAALDQLEPNLHVDNRLHIRWEVFAIDASRDVAALLKRAKKPLLAFNDHTATSLPHIHDDTKLRRSADHSMLGIDAYRSLLQSAGDRSAEVPAAVDAIGKAAVAAGVPMLSHDDSSAIMRRNFRMLGASIAEFPTTLEALEDAAAGGDDIVLGAPNVVRGGSHTGAIGAEKAIARGMCAILASDYYYPSPLAAALSLIDRKVLPFEQAWDLISAAPARACQLPDRGRIVEGLRADLLIIPVGASRPIATLASGRPVYACH